MVLNIYIYSLCSLLSNRSTNPPIPKLDSQLRRLQLTQPLQFALLVTTPCHLSSVNTMILSNALLCVSFSTYLSTTLAQYVNPSNDSSPYSQTDRQCVLTTPYPPGKQNSYTIEPMTARAELKQENYNVSS